MFINLWSSTPKRSSMYKPPLAPLTPRLTTTASPEYPPLPAYDTQWEHVKPGPPSSPDVVDEATFEHLGYSQVYSAARPRGAPPQPPLVPVPPALPSVPLLQERDLRHQRLDTSLAERKATDILSSVLTERKDESLSRKRREQEQERDEETSLAAVAKMDALKEENKKLKVMLQLDAAREEIKQERLQLESEAEKLDAAREEMKRERLQLQSEMEKLDVAQEEMKQEHLQVRSEAEKLDAAREEMKQKGSQLQCDVEKLDAAREQMNRGCSQLRAEEERLDAIRGEMRRERSQLQSEAERLDVAREEMKQERSQLEYEAKKLDTTREEMRQERSQLRSAAEKLNLAREEMKQERSQLQYDAEKLDAARGEMDQERSQLLSEAEKLDVALDEIKLERSQLQSEAEKLDAVREETRQERSHLECEAERLHATREEMKQERSQSQSEAEKLKGELHAAHEAHKGDVETLKMSLQEYVQRIEHLTVECERVRMDEESIRGNLNAEMEQLKITHAKEIEQAKMALEEVNLDRMQVYSELREVRKSLDAYTSQLDANLHEIEKLRRELSEAKDSERMTAELKQRLDIQNKELDSAREQSSALKKELNQFSVPPEDRTLELKGVQGLLTTADTVSGAEVTSTLQRLNAEVLQSTALMAESMADSFLHETPTQVSSTDERLTAYERVSGTIGGVIVHFLGTKKHKEDPILIQIAFQAYLTYHLRWVACAWIIGGDEGYTRFVDAIYPSAHEKEVKVIAGRWRAITRAHVPSTLFEDSQIALQITTRIVSGLSDILLTTGCTAPKSEIASVLSSKFAEKLSFLVSLAMRVNKIVGEDATSRDFEVISVLPGTTFDATTMEDSYDDGESAKAGGNSTTKVLCTTDLGLRRRTLVGMTGEKWREMKFLLKPKVALESVVDIMDE